jgi:hypothetical protein
MVWGATKLEKICYSVFENDVSKFWVKSVLKTMYFLVKILKIVTMGQNFRKKNLLGPPFDRLNTGVQNKKYVYHNVNKVQNQSIYEWISKLIYILVCVVFALYSRIAKIGMPQKNWP